MKRVRFNDVLEIRNGRNQRQVENPEGMYPIYGSGGVMGYADDYICNADTVVVGRKGNINKPLYVEEPFWNVDTAFGLEANRELLLPRYLYYFCKRFDFERLNKAVTIPSLTKSDLLDIEMDLPVINEQERIVEKLYIIETVIEKRNTELEILDELIKARFIEMFGDTEHNSNDYIQLRLGDICDLQNGYAFKSGDYVDSSNVNNCRMSNIRPDGGFDADYSPKYLPDEFWKRYSAYRLYDGDVIIAMTDMASDPKILGVPTIVKSKGKKFLLNQRVGKLVFSDNEQFNRIFLMRFLSQNYIRKNLAKKAGGSTQINVGKPAILDIGILKPPIDSQNQFASFVQQVDKSKVAVQKSLDETQVLFDSLMQEYFG